MSFPRNWEGKVNFHLRSLSKIKRSNRGDTFRRASTVFSILTLNKGKMDNTMRAGLDRHAQQHNLGCSLVYTGRYFSF